MYIIYREGRLTSKQHSREVLLAILTTMEEATIFWERLSEDPAPEVPSSVGARDPGGQISHCLWLPTQAVKTPHCLPTNQHPKHPASTTDRLQVPGSKQTHDVRGKSDLPW